MTLTNSRIPQTTLIYSSASPFLRLAAAYLPRIPTQLIHDPFSGTERRLATYKALLEAKAAGKIRSVGVSNYGVHHLEELKGANFEMPTVNQIEVAIQK